MKKLLHTPDGVRDIYNEECANKLLLQEKLHRVLLQYSYNDIQTPTFEFFNIFGNEIGTTPSKDLYKFFDKEGNTLVLRPDFTPSIARCAAKYFMDESFPVKLCYMGNTFINSSDYQGRLKEITQCGAELIGDGSIAADAEILSMVVESLKASGLKEFQISVGHAKFFCGLVEAAGISQEDELELRDLISNKNFLGVEEFIETMHLEHNLKQLFHLLVNFDSNEEDLLEAKKYCDSYDNIKTAIDELEKLHEYLKLYNIDKYISFELGILSEHQYYTGIIFMGYTFGTGEPVVKGGRYDKLLAFFGKDAPAIGFCIVVDQLMSAILRQKIDVHQENEKILIVFSENMKKEAIEKAISLRKSGNIVELLIHIPDNDYKEYARKNHIDKIELMYGE